MDDYRTPSPDAGHEAIRAPLADAIDGLTEQVSRMSDAYLLLLGTAHMAQSTLDAITALQQFGAGLQAALEALTARVAALESPDPTPAPTGGGTA